MDSTGNVIVQAFMANMTVPIEGASVVITQGENNASEIIAYRRTGIDGTTEPVKIKTPVPENSQIPNPPGEVFSTCDIYLYHTDFYNATIRNVQIFPNVTTLQQTEMIPLEEYPKPGRRNGVVEITPQEL